MKLSFISPGSSPLPPAKCTSVEIYIGQIAKRLALRHDVRCYAMGRSKTNEKSRLTISGWQRSTTRRSYLEHVTADLRKHAHTVVQIDNRPAFAVPVRQAIGPRVPLLLNLHSITFIAPNMIRANKLQQNFQSVDKIVVNSHYLYQTMAQRYRNIKDKLHVIHPGVDIRNFPSRESDHGKQLRAQKRQQLGVTQKTVLMYAGRFTSRKGIVLLLQVFAQLLPQFPNLELWIVGGEASGASAFHKRVRSLAKELPVRFFSYMPADQLPAFYLAADLLLCPSQLSEAFGMVNIEAASCGLPAVGSDAWGIRESIAEGVSGWRVRDYKQIGAWTALLTKLLRDPEKLQDVGRTARTWAENSFSWERVTSDFEALYRSLQQP